MLNVTVVLIQAHIFVHALMGCTVTYTRLPICKHTDRPPLCEHSPVSTDPLTCVQIFTYIHVYSAATHTCLAWQGRAGEGADPVWTPMTGTAWELGSLAQGEETSPGGRHTRLHRFTNTHACTRFNAETSDSS